MRDTFFYSGGVEKHIQYKTRQACASFEVAAGGYEFSVVDGKLTATLQEGYVA